MSGKNSRRKFFKQLFALSAFSASSIISFKGNNNIKVINLGATEAHAMDNPEYDQIISTNEVRIKYKGKSCFLITTSNGIKIITDPFNGLGHQPADIVTVSCGYYDHCTVDDVGGFPYLYKGTKAAEIKGMTFRGVASSHLEMGQGGQKIRPGDNYIICFEVEDIKICHLGALGHKLSNDQVKQIGKVDILMVPVGGIKTLPVADAVEACDQLNPKVIIPMNYRKGQSNVPPGDSVDNSVDSFLKLINNGGNIMRGFMNGGLDMRDFKLSELPSQTQVIVL